MAQAICLIFLLFCIEWAHVESKPSTRSEAVPNVTLSAHVSLISNLQCQKELVCRVSADDVLLGRLLEISITETRTQTVLRTVASIYYMKVRNSNLGRGGKVETLEGIISENGTLMLDVALPINKGFAGEEFSCSVVYYEHKASGYKTVKSEGLEEIHSNVCQIPDVLNTLATIETDLSRCSDLQAHKQKCNLPDVSNKLDDLNTKLNKISDQATGDMGNVLDLSSKLDDISTKLRRLSSNQARGNVYSIVPDWRLKMDDVLTNITKVLNAETQAKMYNVNDLSKKLDDLETKLTRLIKVQIHLKMGNFSGSTKTPLDRDEKRPKATEGQTHGNVCAVPDLSGKLNDLDTKLSKLFRKLDDINTRLSNVEQILLDSPEQTQNNLSHFDRMVEEFSFEQGSHSDLQKWINSLLDVAKRMIAVKRKLSFQPNETLGVHSCDDLRDVDEGQGISPRQIITWSDGTKVLCDTQTDGGGWTIVQRRFNGSVDFNRGWVEYDNGFGSPHGELWFGLNRLQRLLRSGGYELRIDMTYRHSNYYALYSHFTLSPASGNYRLSVDGHSGTAGDDLSYHNKYRFSTYDRNYSGSGNCPDQCGGGWWYYICHPNAHLNGVWASLESCRSVTWGSLTGPRNSLTSIEMKVRRKS